MNVNGSSDHEARLDRIENKIDRLSEAMIDLARAEEKLVNFERFNQQLLERVNNTFMQINERMHELEMKIETAHDETKKNTATVQIINRAAIIVGGAVAAVLGKLFITGI
jgi:tetrahydromethanopterin S-methyltransferase subunit G|tara:strand:+ start:2285 stop:2614 length:330 start_codon:yes stop_codon:yes gene_type:complete